MDINLEREFGWEDEIQQDSEFILLPEGDYPFKVESYTRERFNGSKKMPACNVAVLKIRVDDPQSGQSVFINHRLNLHSRTEWALSEFFAGIGQKKKGEKLRMNWTMVPGSTGTCKVVIEPYKGNDYNKIKKFYPKDPSYNQPVNTTSSSSGGYTAGQF